MRQIQVTFNDNGTDADGVRYEISGNVTFNTAQTSGTIVFSDVGKSGGIKFDMGGLFRFVVNPVSNQAPSWNGLVTSFPFTNGIASDDSFASYLTGTPPITVTANNFPSDITVNSTTQVIHYDGTNLVSTYPARFLTASNSAGVATSSPFSLIVALGTHPPVWTPQLLSIPQGGSFSFNTICSDPDVGDSIVYSAISGFVNGISLSSTGTVSVSSVVSSGAYTLRAQATDLTGRTADSGNLTLSVTSPASTLAVVVSQAEMVSFAKLMGFSPASQALTPAFSVSVGAMPANTFLTAEGIICAYKTFTDETLPVATTYTGITIQIVQPGGSTIQQPITLTINPANAQGFTRVRGSLSKYHIQSLVGQLQDSDVINVTPRTYYDPLNFPYCMGGIGGSGTNSITRNITIQSATAGSRWIIDCRDTMRQPGGSYHWAGDLIGIDSFVGSTFPMSVTISDGDLRGLYNTGNGQADDPSAFHTKGNSTTINTIRMRYSNCNSGAAPGSGALVNWYDTDGEAFDNGTGPGPGHNAYAGFLTNCSTQGFYSHTLLPLGDTGHLFKSKAKKTTHIAGAFVDDNGRASACCDFSIWGDVLLQGCLLVKGFINDSNATRQLIQGREWSFNISQLGTTNAKFYQNTLVNQSSTAMGDYFDFGHCGQPTTSVVSGGSLPARNRWAKFAYISSSGVLGLAGGFRAISSSSLISNTIIQLISPPAAPGASTWASYISSTSAGPYFLQASSIPIGTNWSSTEVLTGTQAATTGTANLIYPDPNWNPQIHDNIIAGANAPACNTVSTVIVKQNLNGIGFGGSWYASQISSTNVVVASTFALFNTVFTNPSNLDYSLTSTGIAIVTSLAGSNTVQGGETPAGRYYIRSN